MSKMTDLYQSITDTIAAQLAAGVRPWHKPWTMTKGAGSFASLPLRHNGLPYQGMNVLLLWEAAASAGYTAPVWMTYKQAQELGGQVRKGERSASIVYANTFIKEEEGTGGEIERRKIPFLKTYNVFNVEQIDGLPARYLDRPEPIPLAGRIDAAESFFGHVGAAVKEEFGDRACYSPLLDCIRMPQFAQFESREHFYSTLGHEHVHWTGHPSRCARKFGAVRGDEDYAFEELVAELGAAFLCAHLGLSDTPRPDHADYIGEWLRAMRSDKRVIFRAAAAAQKAVNFMIERQPGVSQAGDDVEQQEAA